MPFSILARVFPWIAILSACSTTAFPPASLDWGHGATPLQTGEKRTQAGFGGGVTPVFADIYIPTSDQEVVTEPGLGCTASVLRRPASFGFGDLECFYPAAIGAGGGVSYENQSNERLLLRADISAGVELNKKDAVLKPVVASYVGTQFQIDENLALRTRLGLGGVAVLHVPAVVFVGGESGIVWSFKYNDNEEEWVYGYGFGRSSYVFIGGGDVVNTAGMGASVGRSNRIDDNSSWYLSLRADQSFSLIPAGLRTVQNATSGTDDLVWAVPTLGVQAGWTWR